MAIRINEMRLDIDQPISDLRKEVSKRLKIEHDRIKGIEIIKESVDARRKNKIDMIYSVDVELFCDEAEVILRVRDDKVNIAEHPEEEEDIETGGVPLEYPPVVIGTGPCGLFCGLLLAKYGYRPTLLERGRGVEKRSQDVKSFWDTGILDEQSNVQFGEGGAGTFSDGKLTTRIKDKRCRWILRRMVENGAPGEIVYSAKPHIGTDRLKIMIKNLRENIISLGGQVRFESQVTDIITEEGRLKGIVINGNEVIPCSTAVLAVGHSARDTFYMLEKKGLRIIPKPFSIGVRIEHLQEWVDRVQYGRFAGHPRLGAADYQLVYKDAGTGRTVYSFCMCPGGSVVSASSEGRRLVTNGMSEYLRDKNNANSALVVSVHPEDFPSNQPLGGVEFQRLWEQKAYNLGGGGYTAPVQRVEDFLNNRKSCGVGGVIPSYRPGYKPEDLKKCLPGYVVEGLKRGLIYFDSKLKGFAAEDAVLTGVETRTSSPVRIVRTETMESETVQGVYPAGEGAGYAGGIMSAAVDGLKVAEAIARKYRPFT
ncbi:MAG: hypothetical protein HPY66_2781 [Firmicutes bacterium]|nr:hypothetical protein [Bacillota bacterium]MDI6706352.1 hypothetical protein [Bacillota bacterium]